MITRIVKLTFIPENVSEFVNIFHESKDFIKSCEGNTYLALMQDASNENIFFTISQWRDPKDLEAYRNSDYFKQVWVKTKTLFAAKAEAWSLDELHTLGKWQAQ